MLEADTVVGLCATCTHSRTVRNNRGSTFWLCRLSETDARFAKYPRLPVLRCSGYEARPADRPQSDQGSDA